MTTLNVVQNNVVEWAASTFPNDSLMGVLLHLREEVEELISDPFSPHEWGDVFMGIAYGANLAKIDLAKVTQEKLEINKKRKWLPPDSNGIIRHQKEDGE